MNFLLGIGRFWGSGDTGFAGVVLKLGVRLEGNGVSSLCRLVSNSSEWLYRCLSEGGELLDDFLRVFC